MTLLHYVPFVQGRFVRVKRTEDSAAAAPSEPDRTQPSGEASWDAPSDATPPPAPAPLQSAPPGSAWFDLVLWLLVASALGIINRFARQVFPGLPREGFVADALGVAYLLCLLLAVLLAARSAARLPHSTAMLLIIGIALAAPLAANLYLGSLKVRGPLWLSFTANNFFVPASAAIVGAAIGRVIRHANTLLAAAGAVIFFDIVMVTMGTVAILLRKAPQTIAAVSVGGGAAPMPGLRPLPPPLSYVTIGPADVLFMAVFLSAIALLRLPERGTLIWLFSLLAGALTIVQLTGLPVPALVPMGLAVLIANKKHAAFTRDEKIALIYGSGFAIFLAAVLVSVRAAC